MTEGQLKESVWQINNYIPSVEELIDCIRAKTGALFGLSARIGAYLGGYSKTELTDESVQLLDEIASLGELYGISFQINDDVDDIKEDEANGIVTIATLLGEEQALEMAESVKLKSTLKI